MELITICKPIPISGRPTAINQRSNRSLRQPLLFGPFIGSGQLTAHYFVAKTTAASSRTRLGRSNYDENIIQVTPLILRPPCTQPSTDPFQEMSE